MIRSTKIFVSHCFRPYNYLARIQNYFTQILYLTYQSIRFGSLCHLGFELVKHPDCDIFIYYYLLNQFYTKASLSFQCLYQVFGAEWHY